MPDKHDMELDARPSQEEYNIPEVNSHCTRCKGSGVVLYQYYIYDEYGDPQSDIGEEPCPKCEGIKA